MTDPEMIKIGDFLTPEEVNQIVEIVDSESDITRTVSRIAEEVMKPNLYRINQATNQENNPLNLAYTMYAVIVAGNEKFNEIKPD